MKSELKEKIKELEKKREDSFGNIIYASGGFLILGGASLYFFIKKPEHYFYPGLIFAGLSFFVFVVAIMVYNSFNKVSKELKQLKSKKWS